MDRQGRFSAVDNPPGEPSRGVGDVLKDIGGHLQQIVRSEFILARFELLDSAQRTRSAAIMLGGGSLFALFAIGFFLLAGMFALAIVVSLWLSALIVGALALTGGLVAVAAGRRRFRAIRPPRDTIQTLKEDLQWIKEEPKS